MKSYRLQITIKNEELHKTIMSIPKTQRGQFITMALHEYIKSSEGKHLVDMFASYKPDIEKLETVEEEKTGNINDIMGEF